MAFSPAKRAPPKSRTSQQQQAITRSNSTRNCSPRLGAQLGGENEALRNLLLDANNKIGELDTIKAAVGKLVDPVSKALRDFEAEKTEKVGLQTVLNNTRTAYGKLRNEVGDLEKKLAASDRECQTLRQDLAAAQSLLHTLETTKTDFSIDVAAARAQIADLEANLAQRTGECLALARGKPPLRRTAGRRRKTRDRD